MRRLLLILVCAACVSGAQATPATALSLPGVMCGVANLASGVLGKACDVASRGASILSAGKQLLGGHVGSAIKSLLGQTGSALGSHGKAALTLAAIGVWVLGGARFALHETAKVLSESTTPHLGTSWFSATYWRVAGIAALLTLPFLFAAAVQALIHSDLPLLLRSALGYLPLAILVVTIAAPVTMLLLSGSDELSGLVSSAAGHPGSKGLALGSVLAGGLSALMGSPFLIFFVGLLTVAGAMTLWMELLMREAAVYVVVLMLPLAFAALVWPSRRIWAIRAVELLIALILSKFAIVAVLSLGGAAMDQIGHSFTAPLVGLALVMMGAFAPWALLRLVPLAELGGSALESLRGHAGPLAPRANQSFAVGRAGDEWASTTAAEMRRAADRAESSPAESAAGGSSVADPRAETQSEVVSAGAADDETGGIGVATSEGSQRVDGVASAVEPAGGSAPSAQADPEPRPRVPGLEDMWQAEDGDWKPFVLGTEGGWPQRVWPTGEDGDPAAPSALDGGGSDGLEGLPAREGQPLGDPGPVGDPLSTDSSSVSNPPPTPDPPPDAA